MGHIHEKIDWTAGAFIVDNERVLLIWHYKLKIWLCPGGHIELDEDPIEAVRREIREEVGLEMDLLGQPEPINDARSKSLILPRFMDRHPITDTHQHIGLFYLAKPLSLEIGGEYTGKTEDYGWFTMSQLQNLGMWPATKYYAEMAIREVK